MHSEEDHKAHDPEHPVLDCSFCVARQRTTPVPLRHGDGSSSLVVPAPTPKEEPGD